MNIYPLQEPLDHPAFTTLNDIRAHSPCESSWKRLLKSLGKTRASKSPVTFEHIIDTLGLDDALWCLRATPQYDKQSRLFAVYCAQQVLNDTTHPDSLAAVDTAYRHAHGRATDEELAAAGDAAAGIAASWEAWAAAGVAARAAEWTAAVRAAAGVAARVAGVAARAAARAAAGWTAASWEAGEAAWTAALADQETEFRRVFCNKGAI
jgi:hypothetical protein